MNKHKQKENGRSEEFGIKGCDIIDTDVPSWTFI
jgi:hypothetical protein